MMKCFRQLLRHLLGVIALESDAIKIVEGVSNYLIATAGGGL
jgi:hypothetical protein